MNYYSTFNISNSKYRADKRSSFRKTFVFKRDINKTSRHFFSWKDRSLVRILIEIDSKPGYYFSGKALHNTVFHNNIFHNSKFSKNEPEATSSSGFVIIEDVEEKWQKRKLNLLRESLWAAYSLWSKKTEFIILWSIWTSSFHFSVSKWKPLLSLSR